MRTDKLLNEIQQLLDDAESEFKASSQSEIDQDFNDFDTTQQRSYDEGFRDAIRMVLVLLKISAAK